MFTVSFALRSSKLGTCNWKKLAPIPKESFVLGHEPHTKKSRSHSLHLCFLWFSHFSLLLLLLLFSCRSGVFGVCLLANRHSHSTVLTFTANNFLLHQRQMRLCIEWLRRPVYADAIDEQSPRCGVNNSRCAAAMSPGSVQVGRSAPPKTSTRTETHPGARKHRPKAKFAVPPTEEGEGPGEGRRQARRVLGRLKCCYHNYDAFTLDSVALYLHTHSYEFVCAVVYGY